MKGNNQTKEDQLLLARLEDLQRLAGDRYMIAAGHFLDAHQRKVAQEFLRGGGQGSGAEGNVRAVFYGGYPEAERCMPVFLPDYAGEADLEELLRVIRVNAPEGTAKNGRMLTHRDYLGSLLALGLNREVTGDILVRNRVSAERNKASALRNEASGLRNEETALRNKASALRNEETALRNEVPALRNKKTAPGPGADIIVEAEIADFIALNYNKAGRTSLEVEVLPISALHIEPIRIETCHDTVASLRLDSVVASAFRLSRAKAAEAIRRGIVSVNSAEVLKIDAEVEEGDRIVLRGQGKVVLSEVGGSTRKERIRITIDAYR